MAPVRLPRPIISHFKNGCCFSATCTSSRSRRFTGRRSSTGTSTCSRAMPSDPRRRSARPSPARPPWSSISTSRKTSAKRRTRISRANCSSSFFSARETTRSRISRKPPGHSPVTGSGPRASLPTRRGSMTPARRRSSDRRACSTATMSSTPAYGLPAAGKLICPAKWRNFTLRTGCCPAPPYAELGG